MFTIHGTHLYEENEQRRKEALGGAVVYAGSESSKLLLCTWQANSEPVVEFQKFSGFYQNRFWVLLFTASRKIVIDRNDELTKFGLLKIGSRDTQEAS